MSHNQPAVEARIQAHGLRLTRARQEIIRTLASLTKPATLQDICKQTNVDAATIYRNLAPLRSIGVIEEITTTGHPSRFALAHEHHHDHITCTTCGTLVHIPCTLPHAAFPSHSQFAKIDHHEVTYYGLCHRCVHTS
jgi:Fur family ferric uptake transcriptional regulator